MPLHLFRFVPLLLVSLMIPTSAQIRYPETKRVDHVDTYHGTAVADPYRWLEDDVRTSGDVAAWVKSQNDVTSEFLAGIPQRDGVKKRLTELFDHERFSVPRQVGSRWVWSRNDGLQNQSVVLIADGLDAEPRVLLDPNGWSADGTVALAGLEFSEDGRYAAYSLTEAGSDWNVWRILDVESGQPLDDELKWCKFTRAVWTPDGRGVFYGRFDPPQAGAAFQSLNLNQRVWYHRIGTAQKDDVLVYARPDHPEWLFGIDVTEDGRWLVINISKDTGRRDIVVIRDLNEPLAMPVELIGEFKNEYVLAGSEGKTLWFRTDHSAPRCRLIAIDIDAPSPDRWREVIAQREDTLVDVRLVGNLFVAEWLHDAATRVTVHKLDGTPLRDVTLPGLGTAGGFGGKRTSTETCYSFSSYATPSSIYRYDLVTGASTLWKTPKVAFDTAAYEVSQVFVTSKDGTRVPMFLTHRRGLKLDGSNPTLLYGYGGFNISMTPGFSPSRIAWLEMGGVYAVANLRGGGEYGEAWHRAGTKLQKQNVFDDFIAAAEWLIAKKYTRSDKLAIQGGSNGGLLVGACMTQRPELFGACLPAVGVMDMLRFHEFTAGRFWTDDYGCSTNPEEFAALLAYSPYHRMRKGTAYPATMVTTADTDDRVVPGHSFKFAAALQAAHAGETPVLIRIETKAGHGAGKPTRKVIDLNADELSFLVKTLKIETPSR